MIFNERRVALVTGGARRLGRHLSELLATRRYCVVIGYLTSKSEAERLVVEITEHGGAARAVQIDVAVLRSVEEAFGSIDENEGRLDLLINNVGNYNPQPISDLEPAHWDSTLQSNLSGGFYCCYHALKRLGRGGQIINIGNAGLHGYGADTTGLDYHVSKSGMLILTRSLAKAYAKRGIRVNMVSPGMLTNSIDYPDDIEEWVPLGRGGELEDIGQAVNYLLEASYVTGVNIDVAGGYRL
jgi:NAD(P)-dependent dehydrogenase (short-subunit alcohol dehydrogenase family)